MPIAVREFQPTPNPNALKCVLDRPIPGSAGMRSYRSAADALGAGDHLAGALLAVEGVAGVLISDGWITVNRQPAADWKAIKRGVQRVLDEAADGPSGGA